MPIASCLATLLNTSYLPDDDHLRELILAADQREDAVFYACNFKTRKIEYISHACQTKMGYSQEEMMKGGPDFIYGTLARDVAPEIIQKHYQYLKQQHIECDPNQILIQEYPTIFVNREKGIVSLSCFGVILTYQPNGDWEFGVAFLTDPIELAENKSKAILRQIKLRHNEVYSHPPIMVEPPAALNIVHVTNERIDERISVREKEVLKLLAQGFSTLDIARAMHITENTAETHRRHLLEKFEAKNSAELVKRASKVFWLE